MNDNGRSQSGWNGDGLLRLAIGLAILLIVGLVATRRFSAPISRLAAHTVAPDTRGMIKEAMPGREGRRWLYIEGAPGSDVRFDRAFVTVNANTRIYKLDDGGYVPASMDELQVGKTVEVMITGMVMESYPVQVTADEVLIISEFPDIHTVRVVIGDQPTQRAERVIGAWQAEDLTVGSDGSLSGRLTIQLQQSTVFDKNQDVLMVQVEANYLYLPMREIVTVPAGEMIPVLATRSTDKSAEFELHGKFDFPPVKYPRDEQMPLDSIHLLMTWYRLGEVRADGYTGIAAKIAWPDTRTAERRQQGTPITDRPVNRQGTVDLDVRGSLDYTAWFAANIRIPENSALPTSIPTSDPYAAPPSEVPTADPYISPPSETYNARPYPQ